MRIGPDFVAEGVVDTQDVLVSAAEPLASLQIACGGDLPGPLAIPALAQLVRKSRRFGLTLARAITAQDHDDRITAWVEVSPSESQNAGADDNCVIGVVNWQTQPLTERETEAPYGTAEAIDRSTAELHARLDSRQTILSASAETCALEDTAQAMRDGMGRPWTDFVTLSGSEHRQPLHWRLLDGSKLKVAGDPREFRASLLPLGNGQAGNSGFDLLIISETAPQAPQATSETQPDPSADKMEATVGREIAPVLRQPIARIIANAETIRTKLAGPLADEYSDYAADIATAGQHLMALLDDLADLEVVENEEFSTAPDEIDLADVARRAVGILGVRARERGIIIDGPSDEDSAPAIAEFRRVLQILLNLIGNAIRYSPEGALVHLTAHRDGSLAHISVTDKGPGLSQDDQAKVFGKFERLGRSGDGGSGLGLYISRRLARAMDGDITVASTPGEGARFTLTVPGQN